MCILRDRAITKDKFQPIVIHQTLDYDLTKTCTQNTSIYNVVPYCVSDFHYTGVALS